VRILSATHKNLAALVESGGFRQDLFYRINVIELHIPSLRQRREDIPLLVEHILERLAEHNEAQRPTVSPDALAALQDYPFPGNIRELENILERAMTLCEDQVIQKEDLQLRHSGQSEAPDGPAPGSSGIALEPYLGNVEKETIVKALEKARHNKTAAARLLGITFGALRYRMKKLGLE